MIENNLLHGEESERKVNKATGINLLHFWIQALKNK